MIEREVFAPPALLQRDDDATGDIVTLLNLDSVAASHGNLKEGDRLLMVEKA